MRKIVLLTLYWLLPSSALLAQESVQKHKVDSPQSVKSKKLSSDIYEKEPSQDKRTLSAKVKLVREYGEEIEVFLEGKDKGPFRLKEGPSLGLYKERLIKSQKSKDLKANISLNKDFIVSVEIPKAAPQTNNSKSDVDSVLDSILKK